MHRHTTTRHSHSSRNAVTAVSDRPLRDVRVAVTAPRPYLARLSAYLHDAEALPVSMSTISTRILLPGERDQLEEAILRLSEYDLVIFPSRNAIEAFSDVLHSFALDGNGFLALRASGVKLAALGADSHCVRDSLQTTVDFISPDATPQGLVNLLADDIMWKPRSVLVPVPVVSGLPEPPVVPDFLEALRNRINCTVSPIPAYLTEPVSRHYISKEIDLLLQDDGIAALIFSSTAEALALRAILGQDLPTFIDRVSHQKLVVAAHGPVTAEGIRSAFGFEHVVVSGDSSTFSGVVTALEQEIAHFLQQPIQHPS